MYDETDADAVAVTGDACEQELPTGYRRCVGGGIEFDLQLRWGDMDINAHINNVEISRLFEESRVRAFAAWFGGPSGLSLLVVRQDVEFRASMDYTLEPITTKVAITEIGSSSYVVGATLVSASGEVYAVASTTMVAVDPMTGRPAHIPDAARGVLSAWRGTRPPMRGEG